MAPDGIECFKAFIGFLKEKFPDPRSEIKRVFADGDYVILHARSMREKDTRPRHRRHLHAGERQDRRALDVVQDIPEKAANGKRGCSRHALLIQHAHAGCRSRYRASTSSSHSRDPHHGVRFVP